MKPKTGREEVAPRREAARPAYPSRDEGRVDASRRRFLRQVVAGSGAVGLASGLRLAEAQEPPAPDFSILAEHEAVEGADDPGTEAPRRRARSAGTEPDPGRREQRADGTVASAEEWVTENRALWVEPGYLVLVQLQRPSDDEAPVAAFEGAAAAVGAYLATAVTEPQALHDPERVGPIEAGVVEVLAPIVAPATIAVLHLDHDCNIICPAEEPIRPHVRGRMAPPGR